jgi:serine/threonine protein phosphatase PrpC
MKFRLLCVFGFLFACTIYLDAEIKFGKSIIEGTNQSYEIKILATQRNFGEDQYLYFFELCVGMSDYEDIKGYEYTDHTANDFQDSLLRNLDFFVKKKDTYKVFNTVLSETRLNQDTKSNNLRFTIAAVLIRNTTLQIANIHGARVIKIEKPSKNNPKPYTVLIDDHLSLDKNLRTHVSSDLSGKDQFIIITSQNIWNSLSDENLKSLLYHQDFDGEKLYTKDANFIAEQIALQATQSDDTVGVLVIDLREAIWIINKKIKLNDIDKLPGPPAESKWEIAKKYFWKT